MIRAIARGVLVLTLVLCGVAKSADAPGSYRSLTLREFENEGPTLAAQSARVEITGAYAKPGNVDLLYANRASAVTSTDNPENEDARRIASISLLTDQASHGARAALVDCRTRKDVGCQVTLRGQVTMCTITNSLGSSQQFPCLDVRDGGLVSSQVSPGLGLLERARPTAAAVAAAAAPAPENPGKPPESKTPPPPAGTDSDATCYGYVGFVSKDGKFVKTWGKRGPAPGDFQGPHDIFVGGSKGWVYVVDRGNKRIQVFDQDGKLITIWKQFGTPNSVFVDKDDNIFVGSGASGGKSAVNDRGIVVGNAITGEPKYFIPDPGDLAKMTDVGSSASGIAEDAEGNIYAADVGENNLRKYVRSK